MWRHFMVDCLKKKQRKLHAYEQQTGKIVLFIRSLSPQTASPVVISYKR